MANYTEEQKQAMEWDLHNKEKDPTRRLRHLESQAQTGGVSFDAMEALKQDPTMNILSLQQGPYWQRSRWDEAVEKNIGLVEEADRETLKAQIAILTKTMEEQNHFF